MERKLLYVDGLNFSNDFGFVTRTWNLKKPVELISAFVQAAKKSGYTLKVFIDAGMESEEALKKWKTRREAEVRGEYKDVPQGLYILMGDMFRRAGVEVVYSPETADNDDCIAAYANADSADILSNDRDFFRYRHRKYQLFGSFEILDGYLKLRQKEIPKPNPRFPEPPPRDFIKLPEMLTHNAAMVTTLNIGLYRRGVPSPLVKQLGNPNAALVKLRQSVYAKLGRKGPVREEWPEWNDQTQEVVWHSELVEPSHEFDHLFAMPIIELWAEFTPSLLTLDRVEEFEMTNHIFALRVLVAELYVTFHDNEMSVLDLVQPVISIVQDDTPVETPCTNWKADGHCKFGEKCFAKSGHHDCYDHLKGYCRRTDRCRYRHP